MAPRFRSASNEAIRHNPPRIPHYRTLKTHHRRTKDPVHLLLIKGDLVSSRWFFRTCVPKAMSAANARSQGKASFVSTPFLASNGGSLFITAILKHIRYGYRHVHYVTIVSCTEASGTIERLCVELEHRLRTRESKIPSRVHKQTKPLKHCMRSPELDPPSTVGAIRIRSRFGRAEATSALQPTRSRQVLKSCSFVECARAQQLLDSEGLQTNLKSVYKPAERALPRRTREIVC